MRLQAPSRLRLFMAMLAMMGAMWAAVDLHQHEDGLSQSSECITCSLEESINHGFTFQALVSLDASRDSFVILLAYAAKSVFQYNDFTPIRAPPQV